MDYVLCYVDDILCISHNPEETINDIQSELKLKYDKVEEPTYYLGATVFKIRNEDGVKFWAMDSDKYTESAVKMSRSC